MENVKEATKQLKAQIKKLSAEKIKLNIEKKAYISERKFMALALIDEDRAFLRHKIRHHLLAYGFLRGTSYKKMERRCHPDEKPVPGVINNLTPESVSVDSIERWLVEV